MLDPVFAVAFPPLSVEDAIPLSDFSRAVLQDRYLLPGETPDGLFQRVARYFADDVPHAERLLGYLRRHWFLPATPILSNGGTDRGLPISCFLTSVEDSIQGIYDNYTECAMLAKHGGGLGSYWGNIRAQGSPVGDIGESSGLIPFLKTVETSFLAVSQGNVRRGAGAVYLPIDHPEIEEFIDLRRPTGGDAYRRAPMLHHGVVVSDAFMLAVQAGTDWSLRDPHTGKIMKTVSARALFERLILARVEWGEPYLLFIDTVNRAVPDFHQAESLWITQSNLCSEILLPTTSDRTAVCCLSSLNLRYTDEWLGNEEFVRDVMHFLDNVLEDFITRASKIPGFEKAVASARAERSVGLGVMGFHSFLQSKNIPFESAMASSWNRKIFKWLDQASRAATVQLAEEKGPCPDAAKHGAMVRNAYRMAIAPTASISILANSVSPSIEPFNANVFVQKTLSGAFTVRNPELKALLAGKGMDTDEVWDSIRLHRGSVRHLDGLTDWEKDVYKTAIEIDQRWVLDHAADRAPHIDQSQSVNLFYAADVSKRTLTEHVFRAWRKGVKSLYYNRSRTEHRASTAEGNLLQYLAPAAPPVPESVAENVIPFPATDECLACQ
ncbi:ribonucleoside-diphosphate reductase subunit alpha [Thiomonas sp.]